MGRKRKRGRREGRGRGKGEGGRGGGGGGRGKEGGGEGEGEEEERGKGEGGGDEGREWVNLIIILSRYKLTCPQTWPSYQGNGREATEKLCQHHNLVKDVAYGNTKVFIRSPQTLTYLEQQRVKQLPYIVTTIQRVRGGEGTGERGERRGGGGQGGGEERRGGKEESGGEEVEERRGERRGEGVEGRRAGEREGGGGGEGGKERGERKWKGVSVGERGTCSDNLHSPSLSWHVWQA